MASLSYDEAAHLFRRMGFGGHSDEINDLVARGREGAVDYLINYEAIDNSALDSSFRPIDYANFFQLQRMWISRILRTRRPFQEKLVLFWHNHFATARTKVDGSVVMYIQNETLRQYALDRFDTLLLKVSQDPAMLVWLDGLTNVASSPNLNFARELQELFSMGIDDAVTGEANYTENDIREIARAFTGWGYKLKKKKNRDYSKFKIKQADHDNGAKEVYGQRANFSGQDIITIICARRATGRFLTKKLFEFFVYPLTASDEDKAVIERFADVYISSDHSIKAMVRAICLRPNLSFKEPELKDAQGRSTIISDKFGFHPGMTGLKELYDAGRVAVVLGVGDTILPSGSHFGSRDIRHTASLDGNTRGEGWLGRYLSQTLAEKSGVRALSINSGTLTKSFQASKAIAASVPNFEAYNFKTDPLYPANANNQLNAFRACNSESFPEGSSINTIARMGFEAAATAGKINSAPSRYSSSVVYPSGSYAAERLKMIAQIILAVEEAELFHIQYGFFDHHGRQIPSIGNKLVGDHASQLKDLFDGVNAFYKDMAEHGLADNVTIMTWSEFGRTTRENGSLGTDHGSSSVMFVIGNAVRGGLYGQQPSLESTELDAGTNPKTHVDFRSVYATILDRWLDADSASILGRRFENIGLFG